MSSTGGGIHQKLLELERKLRDFNLIEIKKKEKQLAGVVAAATNPGCMTSPLPRRPMPRPLMVLGNGTADDNNRTLNISTNTPIRRQRLQWGATTPQRPDSMESQKRLEEIMQQTGILRLEGKEYKLESTDLKLCPNADLGHGTCGHVVKMMHVETSTVMAVKQMRRSGNKEENNRVIMDLDVVLRSHECPYIVRCFGCFITDSDVWICMELMATCLDKLIKRIKTGIPEAILGKLVVSIVKALNYLKEKQKIIHRDVKPSNMLLDWNGTVKLCDFSISGRLVDSKAKTRTAGCVAYLAPERIEINNANYDIRADVWSLGISLIELATGKFPYDNCKTDFELLAKIVQDPAPSLTTKQGFTPMFCRFVDSCLIKEPKERPNFKELLKSDFIRYYETHNVDVASWFRQVAHESAPLDANINLP